VRETGASSAKADSLDEVMEMIRDAQREWIAASLEDGTPVPEPQPRQSYSGQFRVRLTRSLHQELAERAKQEGTSLNQMVVSLLSRALGAQTARRTRPSRGAVDSVASHIGPERVGAPRILREPQVSQAPREAWIALFGGTPT